MSSIGGRLGLAGFEMLSADRGDSARMQHFRSLDQAQQVEAIRRLHRAGQSPHTIARATGLAVEAICQLLEVSGA